MLKGVNLDQRASKLARLIGRPLVATDFECYDSTMRDLVRLMEELMIEDLCPTTAADYKQYIELTGHVLICHVEGLKLVPPAYMRLSGEPITSIGNGMFNAFFKYYCAHKHGYPFVPDDFFVEGDDNIDALTPRDVIVEDALDLGLVATIEPGYDVFTVSFLGRWQYSWRDGLRTICDVPRTLRKFHLSSNSNENADAAELLVAKSLAYLATDYHCPVVGAVAWAFVKRSKSCPRLSTLNLFRNRFIESGRQLSELYNLPPPPLDADALACVVYHTNLGTQVLQRTHENWIDYGLGVIQEQPEPLLLPSKAGQQTLFGI